jgi:hypothetical protein
LRYGAYGESCSERAGVGSQEGAWKLTEPLSWRFALSGNQGGFRWSGQLAGSRGVKRSDENLAGERHHHVHIWPVAPSVRFWNHLDRTLSGCQSSQRQVI